MKKILLILALMAFSAEAFAIDHPGITRAGSQADGFVLIENGKPNPIIVSMSDDKAVLHAAGNLQNDFLMVSGVRPELCESVSAERAVIVGSLNSAIIKGIVAKGLLDVSSLEGCNEKYLITFVKNPIEGVGEALVIAGSDRRGTVYGIYELSEQIGVSPWYDWADVPVAVRKDLTIARGAYTAGEPAVRYRGIFLNDEAPCLTGWVKHTYGTDYGDHRFYERVFELLLRLRANFIWPAMWSWAFYEDDPLNSRTADEMGIIVGTSHHEPMARNHQEWARRRN